MKVDKADCDEVGYEQETQEKQLTLEDIFAAQTEPRNCKGEHDDQEKVEAKDGTTEDFEYRTVHVTVHGQGKQKFHRKLGREILR